MSSFNAGEMSRTGVWLAMFAFVVFLALGGPASAQEDTIEETTETTSLRETAEESEGQQEGQEEVEGAENAEDEDSAARDQYDNGEDASPTSSGLEEACPSAREVATFDSEGDTGEFTVSGDYLLVRSEYVNENNDFGMGIAVFNSEGQQRGFDQTGEESGTYDFRYDVQPGNYYIEASVYGGSFESTAYDCSSSGGGSGGEVVEGEVIVETIPDKILANTGGPSLLLAASAAFIFTGILGFAVVFGRRPSG